jgi:hypothetical protein
MAAIYQWFIGVEETVTTTLYPVELSEGLSFAVDLDYGDMRNIDNDDYILSYGFEDAYSVEILLTGPEPEDDYIMSYGFDDAYFVVILLTGPEPNDDYIMSYGFDDAYPEDKLVIAYTPDQGLIFTVDLDSANCSMIDA